MRLARQQYLQTKLVLIAMLSTAIAPFLNATSEATTLPDKGYIRHNFVVPYEVDQSWIRTDMKFEGINDPVDFWMFNAIFPVCRSSDDEACVESVLERTRSQSTWRPLTYLQDLVFQDGLRANAEGQIIAFGPFQGRPENLLPNGGRPSVWSSSQGPVRVSVGIDGGMRNGKAWNMMARMSISALNWQLSEDVEFRLVLRMGRWLDSVQGFLQGHLSNPSIELLSSVPLGRIAISGSPVRVTEVSAVTKFSEFPKELLADLDQGGFEYNQGLRGKTYEPPREWNENTISKSFGIASDNGYGLYKQPDTIRPFKYLEEFLNYDTLKDVVLWRVRTPWSWDENRPCYESDFAGPGFRALITTNATVYEVALPTLDKDDSFKIQIGSPSIGENGLKRTGEYHLTISKDLAKCLWKREILPTRAELQVTYADGRELISTLSVVERDDYLYLSSIGFGYSTPILTVKLPKAMTANAPQPQSETSSTLVQSPVILETKTKKRAVCAKGNVKKKFDNKCPKGFKQVKKK